MSPAAVKLHEPSLRVFPPPDVYACVGGTFKFAHSPPEELFKVLEVISATAAFSAAIDPPFPTGALLFVNVLEVMLALVKVPLR